MGAVGVDRRARLNISSDALTRADELVSGDTIVVEEWWGTIRLHRITTIDVVGDDVVFNSFPVSGLGVERETTTSVGNTFIVLQVARGSR